MLQQFACCQLRLGDMQTNVG